MPTRPEPTAIIVVNYGSHRLLRQGLGSTTLPPAFRVVVVDNANSTEERRAVGELCRSNRWALVALPDNRGFGAGVNAGLRHALAHGCSSFILLNPDVVPDPAVFARLRTQVLAAPDTLVSPVLRRPDGSTEFAGSALDLRSGEIQGVGSLPPLARGMLHREWLPATCLALHRDLLARVGPFDEPYFLYWEDVDYSYRCLQAGGRLAVRTDLAVMHAGGGTQEARRGTAKPRRYYRYNCRNRLLFAARHLGGRQLLHWILRSPQAGWHVVLQGGRRQLLRSPMPLLAALHGSVEGLGWAVGALLTNRRDGPPSEGWWTPAVVRAPRTEDAA